MQYYSVWPGYYSFKSEIKLFLNAFRSYVDTVLKKIEETESKLA
ncbi:MAG: hypothetical protein PHV37_09965 [Candidatus Gastranaerophilales bacterium]|nr:hypothetical protein [Candidatus Gastranaerophilales bacterium]